MTVHRAALSGRPACGAEAGKVSSTGIPQFVTCPKCRAEPDHAAQWESIRQAAERFKVPNAR